MILLTEALIRYRNDAGAFVEVVIKPTTSDTENTMHARSLKLLRALKDEHPNSFAYRVPNLKDDKLHATIGYYSYTPSRCIA